MRRCSQVTSSDGLLNRNDIARVGVRLDRHLDSLTQRCELISNIPDSTQSLVLDEVLRDEKKWVERGRRKSAKGSKDATRKKGRGGKGVRREKEVDKLTS